MCRSCIFSDGNVIILIIEMHQLDACDNNQVARYVCIVSTVHRYMYYVCLVLCWQCLNKGSTMI